MKPEPTAPPHAAVETSPQSLDAPPQPFGPLVGPLFWLLIASSLVCILAAVVIAKAGPQLFPDRSTQAVTPHGLGKAPPTR